MNAGVGDLPTELAGTHVVLRRLEDVDTPTVYAATREAFDYLAPWLHWPQFHRTLDDTRRTIRDDRLRWLQRDRFVMGLFAPTDGTFLGSVALAVEEARVPSYDLAYWVRPRMQGRGYVTAGARRLVAAAFDYLGARRVAIYCDPRNERSARVAIRLGFVFEGHLRQDALAPDGTVRDTLSYSIIREEYDRLRETWG